MTRDEFTKEEAKEVIQSLDLAAGRRAFIKALGFGAVGAAVFGAAEGIATPASAAITDADVLNFALNLEYLEATFYHFAFFGTDIPAGVTTGGNGSAGGALQSGGSKVPFTSGLVRAYAKEIATEELKHVRFLRTALGTAAVARPVLDVGMAFQTAASAAGIPGAFNAYTNDTTFLVASYIFEDVGVTAYHGAAGLLKDPGTLTAAAGILAVEAYHAGIIRTSMFAQDALNGNSTFRGITDKISALRSKLANNGVPLVDDIGIGSTGAIGGPDAPTLVPVDAPAATMFRDLTPPDDGDAIAYARSAAPQVLNIVYGHADTTPGLFFPLGMNGTIK